MQNILLRKSKNILEKLKILSRKDAVTARACLKL